VDEGTRRQQHAHASGQGHVALALAQAAARQVGGHQGRRAGRVDGQRRPPQAQGVGQPARREARRRAGQGMGFVDLGTGFAHALGILVGTHPYEDPGAAVFELPGRQPGVLVSHAWGGRSELECAKARELAALGYRGFALDLYGKGVLGSGPEQNSKLMAPFLGNRALLQSRLAAALETLRAQPEVDAKRVAALGYCFGGLCVLDLARTGADLPVDESLVEAGAERSLHETFQRVRDDLEGARERRDYAEALAIVARELKEPVDRYFDDVLVMVDDPILRANRLSLLANIADAVTQVAHIHLLASS